MIKFVTTQDGSPLEIKADLFDTPAAKEFMTTGKNSYIGNAEAVTAGKSFFKCIHVRNVMVEMQVVKQAQVFMVQILTMQKMRLIKACLRQFGMGLMAVWVLKVKV